MADPTSNFGHAASLLLGVLLSFVLLAVGVVLCVLLARDVVVPFTVGAAGGLVIAAVVGLVAVIVANWDKIVAVTSAVWSNVIGWLSSAWDGIKAKAAAVWGAILTWLGANWPLVVGIITGPVGLIIALVAKNWDTVKEKTSSAWQAVKDAVVVGINTAVDFVKGMPGRVVAALGNLGSTLRSAGVDLIAGFIAGVTSKASSIVTTIRDTITDKLPAFVKEALGIHSPSRVFAELGRHTAEGMAVGIAAGARSVYGELGKLTNRVASTDVPGLMVPVNTAAGVDITPRTPYLAQPRATGTLEDQAAPNEGPRTLVLRVGDREFTAYLDERAAGVLAADKRAAAGTRQTRGAVR